MVHWDEDETVVRLNFYDEPYMTQIQKSCVFTNEEDLLP